MLVLSMSRNAPATVELRLNGRKIAIVGRILNSDKVWATLFYVGDSEEIQTQWNAPTFTQALSDIIQRRVHQHDADELGAIDVMNFAAVLDQL